MGDTAAGSRRRWYTRLMVQPGIWALLLLPVMLLGAIEKDVSLRHYAADRQLLTAKQHAELISACLAYHQISSSGENIPDCIGTLHYGLNGTISVIDRSGIILAHPDLAQIPRDMSSDSTIQRVAKAQIDDHVYHRLPDGAASLVSFALIPDTGWHLLIEERLSEALANSSDIPNSGLILSPLSVLLVTIVLIMTLRTVVFPLRKMASQAQKIGHGDISGLRRNETGIEEIVLLNQALYDMAERIQRYQTSAQNYLTKITEVQEAERRRLSHDLHDETMQGLVAVGQRLQLAQRALEHGDQTAIGTTIANARELNQLVMDELRRTIRALRPTNLEGAGLLSALESLLRDIASLGIEVHFAVEGETRQLRPEIELTTFRVAQESISNITKHAEAKHVTITIRFTKTDFHLLVEDDGIGFTPADSATSYADRGHYGLVGMQERINMIGGELKINSQMGQGTRVSARLPYVPKAASNP